MTNYMFASSPSWYCTGAIDSDNRGFLYFGANYNLYVLNIGVSPPKYLLHLYAHQQRAVGVSVCKHTGLWLCCTIGEDGKVKIWDLEAKICLQEHSVHKTALTCVHWSPVDKNLIVSADNKGGIVIWKTNTSEFKYICPEVGHIFAIKCSPHTENIVAVGYKSSSILILDIKKNGQVTQRLRGHDEEIQGLCWCPMPGEQLEAMDESQASSQTEAACGQSLLASSSKDRTIRVWAVSTGRALITLRLQSGNRKDKVDDRVGGRIWVALHWPSNRPTQLVSSSFNGEVLLWDLLKTSKRSFSASKYSRGHNRLVFNATVGGLNGDVLCTASMDRHIVLWDMDSMKAKCGIPTLGGFGYCVSSSPVNPGRLAVGSGDHLIRVWNIDNQVNPFDTQTYWQGLKSKVTALKWHPVKEGQLAYGTEDGRVGIYEVFSTRAPQISSTYHKGTVYTVCWGPPCVDHANSSQSSYFLYSCGDGRLLQHQPEQLNSEAKLVNRCIREVNGIQGKSPNPSEICFKPDYKVVAIGNDDGSVDILEVPTLSRLCCIQSHRKLVNVIRWHPEYTADSRQPSKYRHWLASGSGEHQVHVLDLTQILENGAEKATVITEPTSQLVGHTHRITQLSWSPFNDHKLASASYDHTVQVWDVSTCEPLANYRGHYGRLMCVQWSDLDPDVIYSGGQDNTVQCWQISEQEFTHPPVCVIERKKKNKKKFLRDDAGSGNYPEQEYNTVSPGLHCTEMLELRALINERRQELSGDVKITSTDVDATKPQNIVTQPVMNVTKESISEETVLRTGQYTERSGGNVTGSVELSVCDVLGESLAGSEGSCSVQVEETTGASTHHQTDVVVVVRRDCKERKKKRLKSLFPTSSLRDNRGKVFQHEDCVMLANILYKDIKPPTLGEDLYHIGHFIDRKSTCELFRYEESHHKKNDNLEQRILLELFKGNISAVLQQSVRDGQLSDWTVALAGVGSTGLWRDTAQKFADQLAKDGYIHKATSYLLAARKVNEAIDLLASHGAFKDAVCLARLRLAPNDPKLRSVLLEWAHLMAKDANLEMAAKCYLACLDPLQAAGCLSRRSDLSALQAAASICLVAKEMDAARLYTRRLVQDCFVACDWLSAQEVVSSHPEFMHYGMPLGCHELLVTQLCEMQLLLPDVLQTARQSKQTNNTDDNLKIPKFLVNTKDVTLCPWTPRLVSGEAFCHAVVRKWVVDWGLPLVAEKLSEVCQMLNQFKTERHGAVQLKQLLSDVSVDISLGILQLLLGDGDQAAEHWAVAIATCIDQQEQGLAEGLCRLLLPQGIGRYDKQAQEVHALFVTSSETSVTANRKTSLTLCKNPINGHRGDGDTLPIVHSELQDFTPIACLRAYYCLCVLKFWHKVTCSTEDTAMGRSPRSGSSDSLASPGSRKLTNSPRSSPSGHIKAKDGGSISPDKGLIARDLGSEFSQGAVPVKGMKLMTSMDDKAMNLSVQDLIEVAQCLIWDVQVQKQKIQEALSQIQKSVSKMIVSHKGLKVNNNEESTEVVHNNKVESHQDVPSSTVAGALKRYPSGEYLPMTKKQRHPKRKPHEDILLTPGKESKSGAPVLSMIQGTLVEEDIREVNAGSDVDSRQVDIVAEDDNDTDGLGNKTDKEKVLVGGIEIDNKDEIVRKVSPSSHGEADMDGDKTVLNDAYSNLPDDWFELPVDVKYSTDNISIQLLTYEQKTLQEELEQFPLEIQRLPFPAVFESMYALSQVLEEQSGAEYRSVSEALVVWLKTHKYQTDHQGILDILQQYTQS